MMEFNGSCVRMKLKVLFYQWVSTISSFCVCVLFLLMLFIDMIRFQFISSTVNVYTHSKWSISIIIHTHKNPFLFSIFFLANKTKWKLSSNRLTCCVHVTHMSLCDICWPVTLWLVKVSIDTWHSKFETHTFCSAFRFIYKRYPMC